MKCLLIVKLVDAKGCRVSPGHAVAQGASEDLGPSEETSLERLEVLIVLKTFFVCLIGFIGVDHEHSGRWCCGLGRRGVWFRGRP
jgi:hypothetical protein